MTRIIDYGFEGKRLKIINTKGDKVIEFNFPIRKAVDFDDHVLVMIEPDVGKIYNENVFCVSAEGTIVWQVEMVNHIDDDSPYTNIVIRDEKLFLYCWSGERMEVDFNTGKIINKIFTK